MKVIKEYLFMYDYEELKQSINSKREEDFNALKAEINGLESFFEKCFKVFFENSAAKSERDFNITSL